MESWPSFKKGTDFHFDLINKVFAKKRDSNNYGVWNLKKNSICARLVKFGAVQSTYKGSSILCVLSSDQVSSSRLISHAHTLFCITHIRLDHLVTRRALVMAIITRLSRGNVTVAFVLMLGILHSLGQVLHAALMVVIAS